MDENNNLNTKMIRDNTVILFTMMRKKELELRRRRRFQIFLEIIIVLINAYLLIQIGKQRNPV